MRLVALGYLACSGLVLWRTVVAVRRRSWDPFFAIFLASALIYCEVFPNLVLLTNEIGTYGATSVPVLSAPPTPSGYVKVESAYWLLFLLPLVGIYQLALRRWAGREISWPSLDLTGCHWKAWCRGIELFSLIYLEQVLTHGLVFRRLGASGATDQLAGLPTLTYTIVRSFELVALVLIGILVLMAMRASPGPQRRLIVQAVVVLIGAYVPVQIVNSRLHVVLLLLMLAAWYWSTTSREWRRGFMGRIGAIALIAVVLMAATETIRGEIVAQLEGTGSSAALVISLADNQGLHRLDCVDMVARIKGPVATYGPANGRAWLATEWSLRRYVDASGYRAFADTGDTTAKQYLANRYLGADVSDFYSCALTDMFGNFSWWGVLAAGLIFGLGFSWVRRVLWGGKARSANSLIFVAVAVSSWCVFDYEMQTLLFGWLAFLPVVILLLVFPPFRLGPPSGDGVSSGGPVAVCLDRLEPSGDAS